MNNTLEIEKLNGHCSIQDLGRASTQHLGFSRGGAADVNAFLSANKLLNNNHNDAALELTLGQLTIKAHAVITIALTGADCNATINDYPITHWARHTLHVGDILQLKLPKRGLHTYIAITNGINSTQWLSSRSQTLNEQALGFSGEVLKKGTVVNLHGICSASEDDSGDASLVNKASANASLMHEPSPEKFYPTDSLTLRFIPNKTWYKLSTREQKTFCETQFSINAQSNRMGYRFNVKNSDELEGEIKEKAKALKGGLSKPVTYGTIQLPMMDSPIVLMAEHQTIGGYPVIGSVIQIDLFRLCQKRPGEIVRFTPTSLTFARQQLSAFHQRF
jgi:biotin-dependent carboxylase-like uncharacterized protein